MDPAINKEPETSLKQIRTFQGDVADVLQREHRSLVSIQRAEQLKNPQNNTATESSQKKMESFYLLVGSLLLFALGAIGAWYGYYEFIRRTATPIATAPVNRFVAVDSEININLIDISRQSLISAITDALSKETPGQTKQVIFIKTDTQEPDYSFPVSELLKKLEVRAPGNLVRAFDPPFMLGALEKSVFLIIQTNSFENAFAGMLAWEKNLNQDLGPIFATAELSRSLPAEPSFTDLVDKNKDVRTLVSDSQLVLLYSFFDNKLIITDSIETLRVLIDRLTREKLSR